MTRSIPDPLFAAAARAEVERRVRASAGTAPAKPRRPWVMELGAIAGVAAIVAGVAFGVSTLRPTLDDGGAPVGATTQTVSPTTDPAPLRTGPAQVAPIEVPTTAPATGVPTAPPTTTAPTTPHTTTPPPAPSAALIGPTGAKVRTSAEIRAWALSFGFGQVWAEQRVLEASCMAEHGYLYDPEFVRDAGLAAQHAGLSDAQYDAFQVAFSGPQTDLPYTWQTAGCQGLAVHQTGQDNAN